MYRVFEKSGISCDFTAESANDTYLFVKELAVFVNGVSRAVASAIVVRQKDDAGRPGMLWKDFFGEVELVKALAPHVSIQKSIDLAAEKGKEFCLAYDKKTGGVVESLSRSLPPKEATEAQPAAEAEPTKQGFSGTQSARGVRPALPSGQQPSTVPNATPETQEAGPPKQGPLAGSDRIESVVWIRPLAANHVLVSICPLSSLRDPLSYIVRNAHQARAAYKVRHQTERKFEDSRRVLRLAEGVTEKLPFREQAYQQANEIRRYLECDRVTLFDINNNSATALAVSGQPKFNPRSNTIGAGQSMVSRIAKTGEPFWFEGNFEDLADSLKDSVRRYTDESLVNSFALLPLIETIKPVYPCEEETMQEAISPGSASKQKTIGAVLVEQIEGVVQRPVLEERWDGIQRLVLNQYRNSRKYDSIFLVPLWTMLGRFAALYRGQTARKAFAITALIAAVLIGALIIPVDFKVRCEGYLVFDKTMEFYSKGDGEVIELNVFDGKPVKRGDVLLVQQNHDVKMESTKLIAEITQKQAEVDDLNDSRIRNYLTDQDSVAESPAQLTQRVVQLEVELEELKRQLALVNQEQQQLLVTAPFGGIVAGWKTERRLLGRPLEKGTHLFSLIPSDASFKLELRVPDQRAGYVQDAWLRSRENNEKLPVVFRLASAPGKNRKATVNYVSPALERDEHIGYSLPIYAMAEDEIPESERKSKTAVLAKVICGRRSFAWSKSYEVIDWIRSKLFEYSF